MNGRAHTRAEEIVHFVEAMYGAPLAVGSSALIAPARPMLKCRRKTCLLGQRSHGRNDAGEFVCKDGETSSGFYQGKHYKRSSMSYSGAESELMGELFRAILRGGDVRQIARRDGFSELAGKILRMARKAGGE